MSIFDIFSRRKAAEQGIVPVLQVETLPEQFRNQVARILIQTIGYQNAHFPEDLAFPTNRIWRTVHDIVAQEHGLPRLYRDQRSSMEGCLYYLQYAPTDFALDLIGVALQSVERQPFAHDEESYRYAAGTERTISSAIREFNERCLQNGVGYAYEGGRIIPASSPYVHSETVNPALRLLSDGAFRGAEAEFLKAHEHLRRRECEAAIVESGKAFESTMKIICDRKRWRYEPTAQVKHLVQVMFDKGLVPTYLQDHFASLRNLLVSTGTVRNKDAAHGRGSTPADVPRELAEYALHLVAVNIVFLVRRFKAS